MSEPCESCGTELEDDMEGVLIGEDEKCSPFSTLHRYCTDCWEGMQEDAGAFRRDH